MDSPARHRSPQWITFHRLGVWTDLIISNSSPQGSFSKEARLLLLIDFIKCLLHFWIQYNHLPTIRTHCWLLAITKFTCRLTINCQDACQTRASKALLWFHLRTLTNKTATAWTLTLVTIGCIQAQLFNNQTTLNINKTKVEMECNLEEILINHNIRFPLSLNFSKT